MEFTELRVSECSVSPWAEYLPRLGSYCSLCHSLLQKFAAFPTMEFSSLPEQSEVDQAVGLPSALQRFLASERRQYCCAYAQWIWQTLGNDLHLSRETIQPIHGCARFTWACHICLCVLFLGEEATLIYFSLRLDFILQDEFGIAIQQGSLGPPVLALGFSKIAYLLLWTVRLSTWARVNIGIFACH